MREKHISIANKTRGSLPRVSFETLKNAVLGEQYELSVALLSPREARAVSKKTKHRDTPSNVLAFPLSKHAGEILLCPATARTQARAYGATPDNFLAYLFIHGMLHLRGYTHSATMERSERRFIKRFHIAIDV